MIGLRINDHHIVLAPDAEVQLELINSMFTEGLEDSFTLPMTLPIRGNERGVDHIHQLPLHLRELDIRDVRMDVDGAPLFTGDLHILGSDDANINASYGIDAFAVRLKGIMLPALLQGVTIPLEQYAGVGRPTAVRAGYRFGGTFQLPMHYNPSLYDDANPDWFPSTQKWSPDSNYEINALVDYTSHAIRQLERTTPWQCTANAGAGQSPDAVPSKWKKTAFGIVNAYDHDTDDLKYNTPDGNFFALVPWLYTKWVLKKALAAIGYTAIGQFMDDVNTDEVLVPNATTLDFSTAPTTIQNFQASDSDMVNYADDPAAFRIHGSDETTPYNQDPYGEWNNSAHVFICPVAGTWKFKIKARCTMRSSIWDIGPILSFATSVPSGQILRSDGSLMQAAMGTFVDQGTQIVDGRVHYIYDVEATITAVMTAGDIGSDFFFGFKFYEANVLNPNVLWPLTDYDKYLSGFVSGWLTTLDPPVAEPDTTLYAHRHVPNVELADWLVALAEAFNIHLTADATARTVRLDYREQAIRNITKGLANETPRLQAPIKLEHNRRTRGLRLTWDVEDRSEEPVATNEVIPTYVSELSLPVPTSTDVKALLLNTRQLLKSVFVDGDFYWKSTGYYIPDVVIGDPDNAEDISPGMKPLHMQYHTIDGREVIIPVLDSAGTSAFFHNSAEFTDIRFCVFKGVTTGPETPPGDPVPWLELQGPTAQSWGYGWHEYDPASLALHWRPDPDITPYYTPPTLYAEYYQQWMDAIVNAEPVTFSLRVDQPFILARTWQKPLLLQYQRYLIQRMPVTYRNRYGTTIAENVQALRLRTGVPDFVPQALLPIHPEVDPVFVCSGEGYGSFTVPPGGSIQVFMGSTTGHFTVMDQDGVITVDPFELGPGTYCLFSSDETGRFSGDMTSVFWYIGDVTNIDVAGYSQLTDFFLISETITTLPSLANQPLLTSFYLVAPLVVALPDMHPLAQVHYFQLDGCLLLANVGILPKLNTQIYIPDAALTQTAVDKIINALDASVPGGNCTIIGGTSSPRSTASNYNYSLCMGNGWTIVTNP